MLDPVNGQRRLEMLERIVVELVQDGSFFYRASSEGAVGESDRVNGFRDVHARAALATQALARLGERLEAAPASHRA
jgi:hypothetical protein